MKALKTKSTFYASSEWHKNYSTQNFPVPKHFGDTKYGGYSA